jgi:hypothetical protein
VALYSAYGEDVLELHVKSSVKRRVFFAISMRRQPAWLSWYVFEELVFDQAFVDFSGATVDDVDEDFVATGQLRQFHSVAHFSFNPQINVNAFANMITGSDGLMSSHGTCAVVKHGPTMCLCSLSFKNKSGLAQITLSLKSLSALKDLKGNGFHLKGVVHYIGSVDLKAMPLDRALARPCTGPDGQWVGNWFKGYTRPDLI